MSTHGNGRTVLREMTMAAPTTPVSDLDRLPWQAQGEYLVVTDGTCLYVREGKGSVIWRIVFSAVLALSASGYGGRLLLTQATVMSRTVGGLMLVGAAVFACVVWSSARRGRWMIVYDRGSGRPGAAGEIRYGGGRCLPADRVRCLSTRPNGGSIAMPRRLVVAELHDGTFEAVGPSSVSTWPDHYARQAASWMGLPYRDSTD
jgi:hypothetical protein